MSLRPSRPLLAACIAALGLLVVAGCDRSPAPDAAAPPAVPALHPEVDDLAATEVTIDTDHGAVTVAARVAEEPAARRRGLMEVPEVPGGAGMLFLFEADTDGGFWMKDTLVPLDIAFVDAEGRIVDLFTMEPCDADPCPVYRPDAPYRAALEVRAGWLADHDVGVDDRLRWDPPVPAPTDRSP